MLPRQSHSHPPRQRASVPRQAAPEPRRPRHFYQTRPSPLPSLSSPMLPKLSSAANCVGILSLFPAERSTSTAEHQGNLGVIPSDIWLEIVESLEAVDILALCSTVRGRPFTPKSLTAARVVSHPKCTNSSWRASTDSWSWDPVRPTLTRSVQPHPQARRAANVPPRVAQGGRSAQRADVGVRYGGVTSQGHEETSGV